MSDSANTGKRPDGIPHPEITYEIQRQIDEAHWHPAFDIEKTKDINTGYCRPFAINVWTELDHSAVEIVSIDDYTGSHTWLRFEGRHYDSEVPKGVDEYEDLPYWQRHGIPDCPPSVIKPPESATNRPQTNE